MKLLLSQGKFINLIKIFFPLLYHAIESEKNESFYKISFNNQKWFVKIENFNIRNRNLSLVTLLPQTVITKSLYLHLFYQIFASLILTFIVLIYITNRYINPLIEIARETSNLGFKEIYFDKFVRRKDEIGHLSKAISDASVKILEARVMERQLEELHYFESIKRSLGEAVHRFKDLINIIQGFATLAQPKVSNEFAKNALDQIINASKRAIYLSKEILSVTGERKYEMKVVDLNSILLSMKSKLETSASKSIQIVYEILDSSLPVKLDIEAFDEVLMNLITNAHDAMPEGGKLTIKTKIASFLNKKICCFVCFRYRDWHG